VFQFFLLFAVAVLVDQLQYAHVYHFCDQVLALFVGAGGVVSDPLQQQMGGLQSAHVEVEFITFVFSF
jgi:hypothetical protein